MRFKLLNGKITPMTQFRLTPDRTVDNKKVHDLFRTLSSYYASPLDMIRGKTSGALWWDVMLKPESIEFYCTVPEEWKREIRLQLASVWPLCAIDEVTISTIIPNSSTVCEVKYRRNNIFALQIDRRVELEPLNSILAITSEMSEADMARLSICAEPIGRVDWQEWAEARHKEFRQGKTPRRTRFTKRDFLVSIGETITGVLQSLFDTFSVALFNEEPKKAKSDDYEKRLLLIDGSLTRGTLNKLKTPTFNAYIRLASYSPDPSRQQIILRTLSNSFNDLTADNELERSDIHPKLQPYVIRELNAYKLSYLTKLDWDKNKMSNEELGRLVELPTAALQDMYKDKMESLDTRQLEVPAMITKGGILLGEVSFKKESVPVYMPTYDQDQLCLPTCVIGGMGSGKTSFACNRAIEFVEAGYSSLVIDPAKSEVWGEIKKKLPKEKRKRILLGEQIISFDFREALRSPGGRSRLAQIILTFFNDNTDAAGAQTQRFLRSAVMGMRTGKLSEIVRIFRDKGYLQQTINALSKDSIHRQTLQEFHDYKPERQAQILAPIMNRVDLILGDPYLEACFNSDEGIDMIDLLSAKEMCTVIDIPDRLNTRLAKDILVNVISFKIDSAMSLRKEEFPFAVLLDEPHQYLRSAELWKNVCVESRKYRLAYHFLFHSFEQIPRDLAQIIKDAGPHYVIYPSSKQTYKALQEEISPFTLEDGLNTKRYHAICALKAGNNRLTPFMCHMTAP